MTQIFFKGASRVLKFIHQHLRKFKKALKDNRGQAGIILILFFAVALVIYAISMNWVKVAQVKTLTIKAADISSAMMASYIASYGEKQFQEGLGGNREVCGWTGLFILILQITLVVIVIIISVFAQTYYLIPIVVAGVLMAAALVMQIAFIEPGISSMWDKMIVQSMSIKDQNVERGIQHALRQSITDNVHIPDFYDMDQDGFYGDLSDPLDPLSGPDYTNRFAYFYTRRLQHIPTVDTSAIVDFLSALREFLYRSSDCKGLFDPPPPGHACMAGGPNMPAECDPCCQPQYGYDGEGHAMDGVQNPTSIMEVRPQCCTNPATCAFPTNGPGTCQARSPYRGGAVNYGMIYDPYYENSNNNDLASPSFVGPPFLSIREKFGRDDEHPDYNVDPLNPRWHSDPIGSPQIVNPAFPADDNYYEDSTGLYRPPAYAAPNIDDQMGIFPFFHKVKDFGVQLNTLTYIDDRQCHWCDPVRSGINCAIPADSRDLPLSLPQDPAAHPISGDGCVDDINRPGAGLFPQVLDVVPDLGADVLALDTDCASVTGGWKKGTEKFCSTYPPYSSFCAQNLNLIYDAEVPVGTPDSQCREPCPGPPDPPDPNCPAGGYPRDCECPDMAANPAVDPTQFKNDNLDDFVYGLGDFIEFARQTINMSPAAIYNSFMEWYDGNAGPWIGTGGDLATWVSELTAFRDGIETWINDDYRVDNCADAWCVPLASCPCVKSGEMTAATGLQRVVDCLNYNANYTAYYPVEITRNPAMTPAVGNAERFQRCATWCTYETCRDLPRSNIESFCLLGYNNFLLNPAQAPAFASLYSCARDWGLGGAGTIFPRTFELINQVPTFLACQNSCAGIPLTMTTSLGTVPLTVPFVPPNMTYTCIVPNSCDPASAFMAAVQAASVLDCSTFPGADCDSHKPAFNACLAAARTCAGVVPSANFNDMLALSCRAACGSLPTEWHHGGCNVSYNLPPLMDFQIQENGLGNSCADVNFYNNVLAMYDLANERCTPGGPYRTAVANAAIEAQNQTAKMKKRYIFLNQRMEEANHVTSVLTETVDFINNFLNDPAVQAIRDLRASISGMPAPTGKLPAFSIYAWQDPKRDHSRTRQGEITWDGYWHIVKTEVRSPGRCLDACGLGGAPDPAWPYIRTYTKSWGMKRCYELTSTEGMVKTRVIRWDEQSSPSQMTFPNGLPIWTRNTNYPRINAPGDLRLDVVCNYYLDPVLTQGMYINFNWDKAFIINFMPDGAQGDQACWNLVHTHLLKGVMSEACARYTFVGNEFQVRFMPCDDNFRSGLR